MKFLLVTFLFLLFSGCALPNAAQSDFDVNNNQSSPMPLTENNENANIFAAITDEAATINEAERDRLEIHNDKFRQIPTEFKAINFQKFQFPFRFYDAPKATTFSFKGQDQYDYDFESDHGWFAFDDVFYVDLTGDDKKEAIILLWHVQCGGSCDGGSGLIYVYAIEKSRPKLLWQFETGSLAYGLGLKSFKVKDKTINIEEFGECPDANNSQSSGCNFKFGTKNIVKLSFAYNGKQIVQNDKTIETTRAMKVINYPTEISIDN